MKTKNEVLAYLLENGHNDEAITKITGFLVGAGLKDEKEVVKFKRGNGLFSNFLDWFHDRKPKRVKGPAYTLFSLVVNAMESVDADKEKEKYLELREAMDYLVGLTIVDLSFIEGSQRR